MKSAASKVLTIVAVFITSIVILTACDNLGNQVSFGEFADDYLENDFKYALSEIGADEKEIKNLEREGAWISGDKYKFEYKNTMFHVYVNEYSTVESINYANEKIYKRGYEPYDIGNYIFGSKNFDIIRPYTENIVKIYLNYPSTAKFPSYSSDYNIDRVDKLFYIGGIVKAANAFGYYDEINYVVGVYFNPDNDSDINNFEVAYIKINGDVKKNKVSSYADHSERKTKEPKYPYKEQENNQNGIVLNYGETGEYGNIKQVDGYEYIYYYLEPGEYNVITVSNYSKIYVDSNETYVNEEGYIESIISNVYELDVENKTTPKVISVPENFHVELVINARVVFNKIN